MNRDQYSSEAEYLIAQSLLPIGEARQSLARHRGEVIQEAAEAAKGELLQDNTGTSDDDVYNQGVRDAVAAVERLLKDGAR